MNCRPGELAIIISVLGYPRATPVLGTVVRTVALASHHPLTGPMWQLEEPVWLLGESYNLIADAALKPLRDPGDDAIDESRAWLPPVPKQALQLCEGS